MPLGMLENVGRHGRLAAELPRQRPFRADAVGQDAAEHLAAGRHARDLFDFRLAIDRKQANAERVGACDVPLLLDRIAIGDAVRRAAGRQHHLDLLDRGGVEARSELLQQRQHLRRRVGLHGVKHARVGQRLRKGLVVVTHDVEVDDKARPVAGAITQKVADARSHGALLPTSSRGTRAPLGGKSRRRQRVRMLCGAVRWRHGGREGLFTRRCCLGLERENPFRTAGKTETSLLVSALEGRRDLEARSVVASSRVPRSERGKPVSLPAAGHSWS